LAAMWRAICKPMAPSPITPVRVTDCVPMD
jgi:hypothetical protein